MDKHSNANLLHNAVLGTTDAAQSTRVKYLTETVHAVAEIQTAPRADDTEPYIENPPPPINAALRFVEIPKAADDESMDQAEFFTRLAGDWCASEEVLATVKLMFSKIDELLPEIKMANFEYTFNSMGIDAKQKDLYVDFVLLPPGVMPHVDLNIVAVASGRMEFKLNNDYTIVTGVMDCFVTAPEYGLISAEIEI